MLLEHICIECGKTFKVKPSDALRKRAVFCSRVCHAAHKRLSIEDRFWLHVEKGETCWLWTGACQSSGHGVMNSGGHSGKAIRTHRASWLIHNGPIPPDMFVCHHCDTPSCVNPAHLFLGTQADNMRDMRSKQRHARGEKSGKSLLSTEQVLAIRKRYADGGIAQQALALEYGVARQTISDIVTKRRWAHLP